MPTPEAIETARTLARDLIASNEAVRAAQIKHQRIQMQYHKPIPGKPEHGTTAMRRIKGRLDEALAECSAAMDRADSIAAMVDRFLNPPKANQERKAARRRLWDETLAALYAQ
jgi:hypothetical protein